MFALALSRDADYKHFTGPIYDTNFRNFKVLVYALKTIIV